MSLFEIGNKIMFFTELGQIKCGTITESESNKELFTDHPIKLFTLDSGSIIVCYELKESHKGMHAEVRFFDERIFSIVKANIALINELKEENKEYFK